MTDQKKRIAIIGAGAMGICLASMLDDQANIVMVCRNPQRASSILSHGVRIQGMIEAHGNPLLVRSIRDLERIGAMDAVFVATKTSAIHNIASDLRDLLPRIGRPCVISFQNGIDPGRELIRLLNHDSVLRMVLHFGAAFDPESGALRVTLNRPPHRIGFLDEAHRPQAEWIAQLLTTSGFETVVDEHIERAVWAKAIVNAAANPVCALVNSTVGEVLDSPSRLIVDRLIREGIAVARHEQLDLGDDFHNRAFQLMESARDHTPSMVEDIRGGRESEVGQLNRAILEHARVRGVEVPTHEVIDALIETFDFRAYRSKASEASP